MTCQKVELIVVWIFPNIFHIKEVHYINLHIDIRFTLYKIINALFWLLPTYVKMFNIQNEKDFKHLCNIPLCRESIWAFKKLFPIYGVFLKYFKGRSISIKVLKLVLKWCVKRENSLQGVNCTKWPELLLSDMKYWNKSLGI